MECTDAIDITVFVLFGISMGLFLMYSCFYMFKLNKNSLKSREFLSHILRFVYCESAGLALSLLFYPFLPERIGCVFYSYLDMLLPAGLLLGFLFFIIIEIYNARHHRRIVYSIKHLSGTNAIYWIIVLFIVMMWMTLFF